MNIFPSKGYLSLEQKRTWLHGLPTLPQVTPFGCLVTVYILNVVAWGAMDFLLFCNVSPAMCHPTCDDPNSSRLQWMEIDSQILVALLCMPAFGLAPLRYRDLYFLLRYRLSRNKDCLHRLAEYNKDWFKLDGKVDAKSNLTKIEVASGSAEDQRGRDSLSGISLSLVDSGAMPLSTKLWKLDFVVWCKAINTAVQAALAGFMWGYTRFDRPSWSTKTFMSLTFSSIVMAKLTMFLEARRVRKSEENIGLTVLV
ncbi:hypothetical protein N7517_006320 [Penicillium concentricum]|uniref:Uncharacterized protein n=1 Tax=Penicillium concentricum TaxID=293559 RepID=A0A9W9SBV6_9EURO|nr:uncharacterized protein N7517_006320 [Penicillium concentricum]KAJ5374314.1 hypothetical protein N7517_006320 [Penicillium concentricum]